MPASGKWDDSAVGVTAVLQRVPDAAAYYVSLDTDAIDPAIAPGINAMEFGGLTYFEVSNLLKGIAAKGRIIGFDVVEIAPGKDHQNMTSLLAARLVLNLLGAMSHKGQIGTDTSRWVKSSIHAAKATASNVSSVRRNKRCALPLVNTSLCLHNAGKRSRCVWRVRDLDVRSMICLLLETRLPQPSWLEARELTSSLPTVSAQPPLPRSRGRR